MSNRHENDEPATVDLSAVRADDALLDALGGADPKVADELGVAELNELLLEWSREVDSEPMPQLIDVDAAVIAVKESARRGKRGRRDQHRRMFVPVAAAAAVLAVTFSGTSVAARNAEPGDALWGLTKVLYADKADSVQASYDVKVEFDMARKAIDEGDIASAQDHLDKAGETLPKVRDEENHDGLKQQHEQLQTQLDQTDDEQPPATEEKPAPTTEKPTSPPAEPVKPTTSPPPSPSESESPPPSSSQPPSSATSSDGSTSSGAEETQSGTSSGGTAGIGMNGAENAEPTDTSDPPAAG